MVDRAEDVQFYWLAADGTRQSGTEHALRAALGGGALTATTLVWRRGWHEWLPANQVQELASSIPKSQPEHAKGARSLRAPLPPTSLSPTSLSPTSLSPTSLSPTSLRPHRGVGTPALHDPARDTLAPSSFGKLGTSRRPSAGSLPAASRPSGVPPPPPSRGRSPMPTLSEEQTKVSATATLRPPGAVPPPARGVPVPAFDALPRASATMTPIPAFGPPGGKLPASPAPLPIAAVAGSPRAPDLPSSVDTALDSTVEVAPDLPPEARRTPVDPMLVARPAHPPAANEGSASVAHRESLVKIGRIGLDSRTVVMGLSALSGALLMAVIGLSVSRPRKEALLDSLPSARPAAAATATPPVPLGCQLLLPAARVAPNIERTVPPYASKIASGGALALGIAASKTKGVGLRLDPSTLDVLPTFEEDGKDAVRGVVPLTRSGSIAFFVDRDDRVLHSAHTVDEVPPFTLGVSEAGFSRVVAGSVSLVWPLSADSKITEPRSAPLADHGYGVTFRRGGQSGAVLVGFVSNDGSKKSELAEIPEAPKFLGTPMIAANASGALIAFAGRDAPEAAWKLYVSSIKPEQAPTPARALIAGDGGSVISPTLASLPGDRWLVQWTEGVSGQYHVHVQSFAADLSPIGQSVLVSPKGANAGQGSLAPIAGGALTLFILTTAGHDELWGATLACH